MKIAATTKSLRKHKIQKNTSTGKARPKPRKSPQQLSLQGLKAKPKRREHGGSLAVGRRRSRRPLSTKESLHITLKSHHAVGGRCLLKHRKMIQAMMGKASRLFKVRVYNFAICGNHLHLSIKGHRREDIQNFFRVFAGHTAQRILLECPLPEALKAPPPLSVGGAPRVPQKRGYREEGGHIRGELREQSAQAPCKKNQRKFWSYLTYSRIVSWGREFKRVSSYITQNTLEVLHLIAYKPRFKKKQEFFDSRATKAVASG